MIRCFVAIELDDATRHALRLAADELDLTGWRPTPAGKYHVTLKFLGDIESNELPNIRHAIEQAGSNVGPIAIRGSHVAVIPNPRRPRVLAAMFEPDDAMMMLVERLEILMADEDIAMEQRAYRPHVTLARKRRGGPCPQVPSESTSLKHITMQTDRIALIQSTLTDYGPTYQVLSDFRLEPNRDGQADPG